MDKPTNLGVIVFLGTLLGIMFVLVFFLVLRDFEKNGQFKHQQQESEKAALALRESREKMEKLLKAMQRIEKGDE